MQASNVRNWSRRPGLDETNMSSMLHLTFDDRDEWIPPEFVLQFACQCPALRHEGGGRHRFHAQGGIFHIPDDDDLDDDVDDIDDDDEDVVDSQPTDESFVFYFNLFDIMRQLAILRCSEKRNLASILLNPVTQVAFSDDEKQLCNGFMQDALAEFRRNASLVRTTVDRVATLGKLAGVLAVALGIVSYVGIAPASVPITGVSALLTLLSFGTFVVENTTHLHALIAFENDRHLLQNARACWSRRNALERRKCAESVQQRNRILLELGVQAYQTALFAVSTGSDPSAMGLLGRLGEKTLTSTRRLVSTTPGALLNLAKEFEYKVKIPTSMARAGYNKLLLKIRLWRRIGAEAPDPDHPPPLDTFSHELNAEILQDEAKYRKMLPLTLAFLTDRQAVDILDKYCAVQSARDKFRHQTADTSIGRLVDAVRHAQHPPPFVASPENTRRINHLRKTRWQAIERAGGLE
jgi:hypothetical protein